MVGDAMSNGALVKTVFYRIVLYCTILYCTVLRGEYKAKKNFWGRPHKIAILDLDAPMIFQPGHLNKFSTQF